MMPVRSLTENGTEISLKPREYTLSVLAESEREKLDSIGYAFRQAVCF